MNETLLLRYFKVEHNRYQRHADRRPLALVEGPADDQNGPCWECGPLPDAA